MNGRLLSENADEFSQLGNETIKCNGFLTEKFVDRVQEYYRNQSKSKENKDVTKLERLLFTSRRRRMGKGVGKNRGKSKDKNRAKRQKGKFNKFGKRKPKRRGGNYKMRRNAVLQNKKYKKYVVSRKRQIQMNWERNKIRDKFGSKLRERKAGSRSKSKTGKEGKLKRRKVTAGKKWKNNRKGGKKEGI